MAESGMWVQGETQAGSSCAILGTKNREAAGLPPLGEVELKLLFRLWELVWLPSSPWLWLQTPASP
jgi:hypothetical protein